jgi:hypothetical protein
LTCQSSVSQTFLSRDIQNQNQKSRHAEQFFFSYSLEMEDFNCWLSLAAQSEWINKTLIFYICRQF